VIVIVLEDMAADPSREFARTLRFLDVDPSYAPASFAAYNEREWPRSLRLARVQARLRRYHSQDGVGDRLARRVYHAVGRVNRARGTAKRVLPDDVRRELRQDLGPDVNALSQLLKRDMRQLWWDGAGA
jgi:hypothetical protein